MAEIADVKADAPVEETLGAIITRVVSENPQGITASEILTAVRKENKIAPVPKSGDINGFLYKNTTIFEIARKGANGVPHWKLKAGSVSPTISCPAMFANIAATCPNAERLLGSIIQALVVEGVTSVTCNQDTDHGRLASRLAKESGLKIVGELNK